MSRLVAGLDLSLTSTGIALVSEEGEVETSRIRTSGEKGATLTARHRRLLSIRNEALRRVRGATLVAVEGPAFGVGNEFGRHDMAGLWWLTVSALHHTGTPVVIVAPTTVKKFATDNGRADKHLVTAAVRRMWPVADPRNHDEADALVLATMCAIEAGFPVPFNVLERHELALEPVRAQTRPKETVR